MLYRCTFLVRERSLIHLRPDRDWRETIRLLVTRVLVLCFVFIRHKDLALSLAFALVLASLVSKTRLYYPLRVVFLSLSKYNIKGFSICSCHNLERNWNIHLFLWEQLFGSADWWFVLMISSSNISVKCLFSLGSCYTELLHRESDFIGCSQHLADLGVLCSKIHCFSKRDLSYLYIRFFHMRTSKFWPRLVVFRFLHNFSLNCS